MDYKVEEGGEFLLMFKVNLYDMMNSFCIQILCMHMCVNEYNEW